MRHQKKGRKLGRQSAQRLALLKSLANSLILKGRIKTTEAKAKELSPFVQKLVTRAGQPNLSTIRQLHRFLNKKAIDKLLSQWGPFFKSRPGGYLRIIKLGPRPSDGAKMAIIEFVGEYEKSSD